jgi:hypothetical protein
MTLTPLNPLADVVSGQYERWVYPEPIRDLPAWLAGNWQWFDPSHAHRLDSVPLFRYRCGLEAEKMFRPGWSTPLSPKQLAFAQLMDGRRTIREIITAATSGPAHASRSPADLQRFTRSLCASLVNRDFLAIRLPPWA